MWLREQRMPAHVSRAECIKRGLRVVISLIVLWSLLYCVILLGRWCRGSELVIQTVLCFTKSSTAALLSSHATVFEGGVQPGCDLARNTIEEEICHRRLPQVFRKTLRYLPSLSKSYDACWWCGVSLYTHSVSHQSSNPQHFSIYRTLFQQMNIWYHMQQR